MPTWAVVAARQGGIRRWCVRSGAPPLAQSWPKASVAVDFPSWLVLRCAFVGSHTFHAQKSFEGRQSLAPQNISKHGAAATPHHAEGDIACRSAQPGSRPAASSEHGRAEGGAGGRPGRNTPLLAPRRRPRRRAPLHPTCRPLYKSSEIHACLLLQHLLACARMRAAECCCCSIAAGCRRRPDLLPCLLATRRAERTGLRPAPARRHCARSGQARAAVSPPARLSVAHWCREEGASQQVEDLQYGHACSTAYINFRMALPCLRWHATHFQCGARPERCNEHYCAPDGITGRRKTVAGAERVADALRVTVPLLCVHNGKQNACLARSFPTFASCHIAPTVPPANTDHCPQASRTVLHRTVIASRPSFHQKLL